jgi:branched-chain amino acid aminotransferase
VINTIAPALGYTVEERSISLDEVKDADEIFLTGTAAEIIGVSHIGHDAIGSGKVGSITKKLIQEFQQQVSTDAPED